jgi:ABC-2 type transport system ATP-binding protein
MLEIVDLSKRYDNGVLAVDKLNLTVQSSEIFVMLGANGAGKTTTMMCVLGFTEPTGGTAKIMGVDVGKNPLEAKKHVAYVSENVRLYGNFTAKQNLDFFTHLAGRKHVSNEEYEAVLARVGLERDAFNRRLKGFSKGMRQRLGIAIAIMKQAEVILLDEPTSGLDPKGGVEFLKLLAELREEDKAIFMTSHDIFRAREIADRVGIMSNGRMLHVITREEIDAQQVDLSKLYIEVIEMGLQDADAGVEAPAGS